MRARRTALALIAPLLMSGCGVMADAPPSGSAEEAAPALVAESAAAKSVTSITIPTLTQDGFERRANLISMRVRNLSCQGVSTGSGWALNRTTLVTNRHVVAGADRLEVEAGDGRSYTVRAAQAGVLGDIAFVDVAETLPVTADVHHTVGQGDEVAAVGYPQGGPFTITRGVVIDVVDGSAFGVPDQVLRVSARVQPGNSGGPLLDSRGRVVGVVYAIETATGLGLAMPMTTVDNLVQSGGFEGVPPCGSQ